ncbi:MAG: pyruvate kinase [Candidatus Pacebacteria bacterium]|nr:pyruvate kinase [Candidatus Paceibacterota bacterium]
MRKKQTKIVATISDRKCEPEFIKSLHEAGVDVMRLNTAHQKPEDTLKVINNIRQVSERIGILIDTKGPEVRVTGVTDEISFKKGDSVRISGANSGAVSSKDAIYVSYAGFHKDVPAGALIFIDDGKLGIKVLKKTKDALVCEVVNDGVVKSFKSVNVPGVRLNLESLREKDKDYIDFSVKHKVDFIAHSFVRSKEDILAIQKILDKKKSKIKIIAKVENKEGVENIDEILDHAYGIMIARGDMGIEMAAEEIPLIQKEIIRKCIVRRKPVIVATQMLQSMVKNPRPTRAEVSDVANAVIDGADAVMLSEESASGDYPVEAVEMMSRIVGRVESADERYNLCNLPELDTPNNVTNFLMKAAISATKEMDIKEIIMADPDAFEVSVLASLRGRTSIYFKCFDKALVRQLALTYGVNAQYVKRQGSHEQFMALLKDLVAKGKLSAKDKVLFLASNTKNGAETNFLEICEVGKYAHSAKQYKRKES